MKKGLFAAMALVSAQAWAGKFEIVGEVMFKRSKPLT